MPLVNDQSPTGLHQTLPSVTSMSGERGEYLGRGSDNLGRGRGYAFHSSRGTPRMRSAWGSRGFYRGGGTVFGTRGEHPGRDIMEGLIDKPLKTLRRDDVSDMEDVAITDLEYVASFNWVESDGPTIIVPGNDKLMLVRRTRTDVLQEARGSGSIGRCHSQWSPTVDRHSTTPLACYLCSARWM